MPTKEATIPLPELAINIFEPGNNLPCCFILSKHTGTVADARLPSLVNVAIDFSFWTPTISKTFKNGRCPT